MQFLAFIFLLGQPIVMDKHVYDTKASCMERVGQLAEITMRRQWNYAIRIPADSTLASQIIPSITAHTFECVPIDEQA